MTAKAIEARSAETARLGPQGESAVPERHSPEGGTMTTPDHTPGLDDLIERLEKAEAGSRELDNAIIDHFGWRNDFGTPIPPGFIGVPLYTASIDHAITLRPDGYDYGCGSQDCTVKAWAWVGKREAPNSIQWAEMFSENAATPALALCLAALHALKTKAGQP